MFQQPTEDRRRAGSVRMDWAGLLRLGLTRLRLTPAQFWALTPIELLVMLGLEHSSGPFTRDRLAALASAYPDETPTTASAEDRGDD